MDWIVQIQSLLSCVLPRSTMIGMAGCATGRVVIGHLSGEVIPVRWRRTGRPAENPRL